MQFSSIIFLNFGCRLWNLFRIVHRNAGSVHLFTLGHQHHHLHGHLIHAAHFADTRNLPFRMLVGTILSRAAQSKFAFDFRMNIEASVAVWASREIFAFFSRMHERALVVGAVREMPAAHLFFAWILFADFLFQIDSFLGFRGGLDFSLILVTCVESLHSLLPGILSAETQIFRFLLVGQLVIIWLNDPLFYADLMCFLTFLVLDYGFEVHVEIMRVLVDALLR